MNRLYFVSTMVLVAGLAGGTMGNAVARKTTGISQASAERIALAKVPGGKIASAELEREKGTQVWSFDITRPGTRDITEVLVDARTGKIVDISTETPSQQAKEAEEDKHGRH